MAQNQHPGSSKDRRANAHSLKQVLCDFEPSSLFHGRFSVQKMAIFSPFSRHLPLFHVSVSNEGRSSSKAIGPSNDCK